jgi:hypothetical protein
MCWSNEAEDWVRRGREFGVRGFGGGAHSTVEDWAAAAMEIWGRV